jgi:hypothetical protein
MNKTEQETEFEQIQNGGQQKQTPVLNIENNDDSIILSQTKTRGRPRKGSVSSNNNSAECCITYSSLLFNVNVIYLVQTSRYYKSILSGFQNTAGHYRDLNVVSSRPPHERDSNSQLEALDALVVINPATI